MSTAMIANLVEELKTSNDKIAKAVELEALLTSLDASIEVKDADYDHRVGCLPPPTSFQVCTQMNASQCCPPASDVSC